MAIQSVKGQPNTVYVIKGKNDPTTMAQYWAQMVSQQKYQLVNQAIQIATQEEMQAAKTDAERQKVYERQLNELNDRYDKLNKQRQDLIVKEQQAELKEDLAKLEQTTITTGGGGGGGRAGSRSPMGQQKLAETKELRKLKEERQEREKEAAEHDRNAELFNTSNATLAEGERTAARKTRERIEQIDAIISPDGVDVDKNGNNVIDDDEVGKILPAGSYERSGGTSGGGGGKKTQVRTKEGYVEGLDLSDETISLQDELYAIDEQIQALMAQQPQATKRPGILPRAAEIAGRTDLGTGRQPSGYTQQQMMDLEQQMMGKYFPNQPKQSQQAPTSLQILPDADEFSNLAPKPRPMAQVPLSMTAGDYEGELSNPLDPAAPPSAMQNRMLNRSVPFAPVVQQPPQQTPVEKKPGLLERFRQNPIDVPPQQSGGPPNLIGKENYDMYEPQMTIPSDGQMFPPQTPLKASPFNLLTPSTPIEIPDDIVGQAPTELDMFNQLVGGGPQEPQLTQQQKNKQQQATQLADAVEKGTQRTRKDVRREIALEEQSDWAKVVMQLYSPTSESTAMERTRLRDNAYQQLYKTYEDDKETLAKATELLISLDALEMGALPPG